MKKTNILSLAVVFAIGALVTGACDEADGTGGGESHGPNPTGSNSDSAPGTGGPDEPTGGGPGDATGAPDGTTDGPDDPSSGGVVGSGPGGPGDSLCVQTGGTESANLCCLSVDDFPSSCLIGACGCDPDDSHMVKTCECPAGQCYDPDAGCIADDGF